ncbi:hypothetical protein [Saccharicrinis aurantiacus]|uniref:hypothetical protein n=1 Tax=Saccharicrinis aurantiacus TaxID=1849719 RepID=UPI000838397B|nr:hypothetical protein [Saccharicrinis aurantiacus]
MRINLLFILTCIYVLFGTHAKAQNKDTIRVAYNQMMICADTIYFGVSDSIVILPQNQRYKLQRNFLLRSNVYYEKRPKKKKQIEERIDQYHKLWRGAYKNDSKEKEYTASQHYFEQFKGKVIRNISFKQVEMFNGTITDTARYSLSRIGQELKKNHIATKNNVIRNNLRFDENDKINPWQMAENERLLRQLNYIEDARIVIHQNNLLSDSVDIEVITKDILPYDISIKTNGTDEFSISPNMRNFMGLGHYIELGAHHKINESPDLGYSYKYLARNISGTFIDAGLSRIYNYEKDNLELLVERPFITTDMELGGAISYIDKKETLKHEYDGIDSVYHTPYKSKVYDAWLGKTFLFSSTGNNPNLSISTRYFQQNYSDRPFVSADSNYIFHDWNMSLSTAMLQKINFFKAQKVQGFGITEDIPVGYRIKATGGYMWNQYYTRPYIGVDYAMQMVRPKKGLLGLNIEAASFYNNGAAEDVFMKLRTTYISPLLKIGNSDYRHFLFVNFNTLHNSRYYQLLRYSNNIVRFKDHEIKGESYLSLEYRPTFHIPYQVIGFNFSLTPFTDIGLISDDDFLEGKIDVVSVHGLTLRIKNESLVIPTFEVDLKFYPKYNRDKSSFIVNFTFRDTNLLEDLFSPKPELIKSW